MLRILHVITTIQRGGAEIQLLTLVTEQMALGNQVTVLFLKGDPELKEDIQKTGAEVCQELANKKPLNQIISLRTIIGRRNWDVVHAHLPRAELLSALANTKNVMVFSRHNSESFFPKAPRIVSKVLSKFVCMRAQGGIAISKAVLDFLVNNGELTRNFHIDVIHYGAYKAVVPDNNLIHSIKKNLDLEGYITLGTVARLAPQKDLTTLIDAASLAISRGHKIKLLVIGDGPLRQELEIYGMSQGIQDSILWIGRTTDIPEYMACMDFFLLTSLYEGFGLVLLEAIQFSGPIIAADNSAIPEVLGENYPGLAKTRNSADFVAKFEWALNPDNSNLLRKHLSDQLLKFQPRTMALAVDNFYLRMITR